MMPKKEKWFFLLDEVDEIFARDPFYLSKGLIDNSWLFNFKSWMLMQYEGIIALTATTDNETRLMLEMDGRVFKHIIIKTSISGERYELTNVYRHQGLNDRRVKVLEYVHGYFN